MYVYAVYCCYDAIILEFYFHLSVNFHNYYNLRIRFMSVFISFLFIWSLFALFCLRQQRRTRTQAKASNWWRWRHRHKIESQPKIVHRFSSLPFHALSSPLRFYVVCMNIYFRVHNFMQFANFYLFAFVLASYLDGSDPISSWERGCSCHSASKNHDDDCCIVGGERGEK